MNIRRDQKGTNGIQHNTATPETAHFPFFKKIELPQVGFERTTSYLQGKGSASCALPTELG